MNYRRAFADLAYRGMVRSVRRTYHVLEGDDYLVVLSPKGDGATGNYSLVPWSAVRYIIRRLGGTKSISSTEAFQLCGHSKYFGTRFDLLNAFYAMIAIDRARIAKYEDRKLFFGVRKGE